MKECQTCGKKFVRTFTLKRHKETMHIKPIGNYEADKLSSAIIPYNSHRSRSRSPLSVGGRSRSSSKSSSPDRRLGRSTKNTRKFIEKERRNEDSGEGSGDDDSSVDESDSDEEESDFEDNAFKRITSGTVNRLIEDGYKIPNGIKRVDDLFSDPYLKHIVGEFKNTVDTVYKIRDSIDRSKLHTRIFNKANEIQAKNKNMSSEEAERKAWIKKRHDVREILLENRDQFKKLFYIDESESEEEEDTEGECEENGDGDGDVEEDVEG
jgi:hypothetical protein